MSVGELAVLDVLILLLCMTTSHPLSELTLLVEFSDKNDIQSLKHSALAISKHFH